MKGSFEDLDGHSLRQEQEYYNWLHRIPLAVFKELYRKYLLQRRAFSSERRDKDGFVETLEPLENNKPPPSERGMIVVLKRSMFLLIFGIISIEVLFDLVYFALKLPSLLITIPSIPFSFVSVSTLYFFVFIFLTSCKLLFMLVLALQWVTFTYEITKEEIRYKYGIFNRSEKIFLLSYTQEVMYKQSLAGKLFNYGTVELYNPTLKETVCLDSIPNPAKYTELIKSYLSNSRDTAYIPLKIH